MSHHSIATPSATKKVNPKTAYSQGSSELSEAAILLSSADMALSSAEMEPSKAGTPVGGFEAVWNKWAKIIIA
jgi:hypothetical protein